MAITLDIHTLAGVVALVAGLIVAEEVISFVVRRAAKTARAGPTVLRDIRTGTRLIVTVLIISYVLTLAGLSSLFTSLTVSGILAIFISLALQTTLSNVISGLLLFSDGVLRLGDTIEYSSAKGQVVRVGLRNTWIVNEAGHLVVVSNSSLSGGPLINHSATERLNRKYAFK